MKIVPGKNKVFVISYGLAILIFLFILFNWTVSILIHSRKEVIVPKIEGKTVVEAMGLLSKLNLGMKKIGEVHSKTLPEGTIVKQFPQSGMRVREGRIINVMISLGGEMLFTPNLIGLTETSAKIKIRKSKFEIGNISKTFSLQAPENIVISQEPPPDVIAVANTPINLLISKGPPPEGTILIPNFEGKSIEEVKEWAKKYGLTYSITYAKIAGYPPNTVIEQEPSADTVVTENTVLKLNVSSPMVKKSDFFTYFTYNLPLGKNGMDVKILLIDESGETVLLNEKKPAGAELKIPIREPKGKARIRLFIDGVLIEEKEL